MQFFRRMMRSKLGGWVATAFLAMMAFAFVSSDITGNSGLNVFGPNAAQVVEISGGHSVSVNDLQVRAQRYFERLRQDKPDLTVEEFLKQGALNQVADEMVGLQSLIAYGEKHGMRISKKLVDAEIARVPAFADTSGNFSEAQFRSVLAQQKLTEKEVRDEFVGQIIRQHLLTPAAAGANTPNTLVPHYAAMLVEERTGRAFAVPAQLFAPTQEPSEAELKAHFARRPGDFALPEQRKLRFITVSRNRFDTQSTPSEAELAAAYKAKANDYAGKELRDFKQLILITQSQAKEMSAKAASGKALDDLAREAGLATASITGLDQTQFAAQANAELAKAAFAAAKGALVGPIKTPLGWALVQVQAVRAVPGKTLDQARAELTTALRSEKSARLFADLINDLDGKLGDGATLDEIAKSVGATITETPLLTLDGRNVRDPKFVADDTVRTLLKPAFAMMSGDDPQVVPIKQDEVAAILAPGDVVVAGPPPFAEIRKAVALGWKLAQGAEKARLYADKVVAAINKGMAPQQAITMAGTVALPPSQPMGVRRIDLNRQRGKVPPPLKALLNMKAGTARLVPLEQNLGYMIVHLEAITPRDPTKDEASLRSIKAGLANVLGSEYATQLVSAIRKDLGVNINTSAIASVADAMRKANGTAR